jgi:hypothetical protein
MSIILIEWSDISVSTVGNLCFGQIVEMFCKYSILYYQILHITDSTLR